MESSLTIAQSFAQDNRYHETGIREYRITKTYVDPLRIIADRQYAKGNKHFKPKQKATKKGSYL